MMVHTKLHVKLEWDLGALADGLQCYRGQEFFQAHEHWESVWLKCGQPEKSFLQALIQMAAAFHHLQRNNHRGAASLLKASLGKLEGYPAQFAGVEVAPLREQIGQWIPVLASQGSSDYPAFPQIQVDLSLSGQDH
jgi:predicted metal-dependent hydrolase